MGAPHRAEGVEPGTEKDRIDADQGLRQLAAHRLPARAGGIVVRKSTRRREQAHVARLGSIDDGPELRDQGGTVGVSGHHAAREVRLEWL